MKDVVSGLKSCNKESPDGNEWAEKLFDRLDSCSDVPDICFAVDSTAVFSDSSVIWELSGLDDIYVQLTAYLILYCLLCQQRHYFGESTVAKGVFAIVDEFQNLDCNRRAVIGTCLTEGQKYRLNLILITQFLAGNFSEVVISQFKQGGFRFYFRLAEEEAWIVSRQLAYEVSKRREICQKLTKLPVGHCLMLGAHSLGNRKDISESFRFVQVEEEPVRSRTRCRRGTVYA